MTVCYCKNEIAEGDRQITITYAADWGKDDERETTAPKQQLFCSFGCVARWASDLSDRWDGVVVTSPAESTLPHSAVVDSETETVVR